MLRIYGLLIILALIAGVGYGAYFYYNDTQQRIATLRTNNAQLESSNKSLEVKIKTMEDYNQLNIDEVLYLQMIIQQNLEDDYIEDDEVYLDMITKLNNKLSRIKNELNNK